MREREAEVLLIAEQAPAASIRRFGLGLAVSPAKLAQALALRARLATIPYLTGCWVEAAEGTGRLRSVRVRQGSRSWTVECDYLGTGYGLVPNTELAELLGCAATCSGVTVDELQRTSVDGVYCAGEACGIGGVDKSIVEGTIAGYAAAGNETSANAHSGERSRQLAFAAALTKAFRLRAELRALTRPDTIVCRCEDVRLVEFDLREGWRDAKLQSRCGMGRCQGRVCGPAVEFLKGWKPASAKPPIFPARVGTLIAENEVEA